MRAQISRLDDAATRLKRASGRTDAPFHLACFHGGDRGPDLARIARLGGSRVAIILRPESSRHTRRAIVSLAALCRSVGSPLFVAADIRLARDVGANGVHWPFRFGPPPDTEARGGLLLTVPCHSHGEIQRAAEAGAAAAFVSPVFATRSHPGAPHLGVDAFRAMADRSPLPVLALGGVNAANAWRLAGPNVVGFGAIDAFLAADRPARPGR